MPKGRAAADRIPMSWQSFQVRPMHLGAGVVEQLHRQLDLVKAIRLPLSPEVAVFRRDRPDSARFFFSGAAVELFKTLVQFHGATKCRRPAATRNTVRLVPEPRAGPAGAGARGGAGRP
jgi:hypothetical protein